MSEETKAPEETETIVMTREQLAQVVGGGETKGDTPSEEPPLGEDLEAQEGSVTGTIAYDDKVPRG